MRSRFSAAVCAALVACGCAHRSQDVHPTHVSTSAYDGMTCRQIAVDQEALAAEVTRLSKVQDDKRLKDQIATGVGLVLFWPAAVYLAVGGEHDELGRIKGEVAALERAAGEKGCRQVAGR